MEQRTNVSVGEVDSVITENEKWFKFFIVLPRIVTILCAIACLSLGIIFYCVKGDAIFLLIFWLGGVPFSVLIYVCLKLVSCYRVLHIYYLKKISSNNSSSVAAETVETKAETVKTEVETVETGGETVEKKEPEDYFSEI